MQQVLELKLADESSLPKNPLDFKEEEIDFDSIDPELKKKAIELANILLKPDLDSYKRSVLISNIGLKLQKTSLKKNSGLMRRVIEIQGRGGNGGINSALDMLIQKAIELDPSELKEAPAILRWLKNPIKDYFQKLQISSFIIDSIIDSLEKGGGQLKRDNSVLSRGKESRIESGKILIRQIEFILYLDKIITDKALEIEEKNEELSRWIKTEILFNIKERTIDLFQLLTINQQAVAAFDILIKNNFQLIRGVDKAVDLTIEALNTAQMVSFGLTKQKLNLETLNKLNKVSSSAINSATSDINSQSKELTKLSKKGNAGLEELKESFKNLNQTIVQVATFQQEANSQIEKKVEEIKSVTKESEIKTEKVEEVEEIKTFSISID